MEIVELKEIPFVVQFSQRRLINAETRNGWGVYMDKSGRR